MIEFHVNGELVSFDGSSDTPLLWVLRDHLLLTGTKYGCGMGLCGACTVHLNGKPSRSCSLPISNVAGKSITTIEGLSRNKSSRNKSSRNKSPSEGLHPVQQAWIATNTPQCGYCQSGQIMSAVALLKQHPNPSDEQIDQAMSGNICRCGAYPNIRKAIHRAAAMATLPEQSEDDDEGLLA